MATSFLYWKDLNGSESCTDYDQVKTPKGVEYVNSWHTQGLSSDNIVLPLCQLIQQKLPRKDLPVFVGDTGYVYVEPDWIGGDGWTLDDLGRTVFIFENVLYFQRYKSGYCIMCYKDGWNPVSKEQQDELTNKLNAL